MRRWRWMALVAAIAFIAVLTLTPGSPVPFRITARLLDPWISSGVVALVLNVLLFVPLGMVIGWFRRPRWLLAATAASVAIELTQHLLPDRNPLLMDVVTNTVGALLGYLGVVLIVRARAAGASDPRSLPTGGNASTDEDHHPMRHP